ncbi:MAG TPA: ADP-glyceromanno-heptose 6-epimerase [Clostridiales bacterium]|nr:ADP-glyceromanno-heptose 6-epimerase [Clostridiales bacterium]HQP68780.1 ADP-glyceromanno-heptose 6-epimerase [Clostridiales bacterium]
MILVTGGAGFIGSAVVWELNRRGIEDIVICDHLGSSDKWKNLRALKYADYIEKDEFLSHLVYGTVPFKFSSVIHMGACSSTTETDCSYLAENNFAYTKILAEFCIKNRIRFIYASSAATYGAGEKGFKDDLNSIEKLRPLNMYGYSKQMFDLYAKRMKWFDRIAGIKFFNVYGPNEYHKGEMSSKIYKAYYEILNTGKIRLFKSGDPKWKDGGSVRDFVYVKDCAKIICDMMNDKSITGLFNLGSGKARSWNDLAAAVFKSMDRKLKIEYFDMPDNLKGRYQYFTESDNSGLKNSGIRLKFTSLEKGVEDYMKNYLIPLKHLGD